MDGGRSGSFEVWRHDLLERLERVCPKIIAFVAPAGFGKSTLARQYLESGGTSMLCDCRGLRDDLDLARRLFPDLAILGDGGTSVADRVDRAVEAWGDAPERTVVFENADTLVSSLSARAFFARLMATCPDGRTIVICSRRALQMQLSRFAAPHKIVVLRARDLAFDRDDVRSIFQPFVDDERVFARIAGVSRGWPIAVLLLRRFAAEGRMTALLERVDDIAFEELHDYLIDEVVDALPADLREALFACAGLGCANAEDLRAASDGDGWYAVLAEFAKESPFVDRDDNGACIVHPLLATVLLEYRDLERRALLCRIALRHGELGDRVRSAELYLRADDPESAAAVLALHEFSDPAQPFARYLGALAALDRQLVRRHPRLWSIAALLRVHGVGAGALRDEAESIWRTLSPDTSPADKLYLLGCRVLLGAHLGKVAEGLAMLDRIGGALETLAQPRFLRDGYVGCVRGMLLAQSGRLNDAELAFAQALPLLQRFDILASGAFASLGGDIARARGERALEREFQARASESAESSMLFNAQINNVVESAFGAWFAGEDALFARLAAQARELVERHGAPAFAYFVATACDREVEPLARDSQKAVVYGRLIALTSAASDGEARALARNAFAVATSCNSPFLIALSAIAVALTDRSAFAEFAERAQEAASACESPELQTGVRAVVAGQCPDGMLQAFVARLARDRAGFTPVLEVEVVTGKVRVNGRNVHLSGRELELLAALSLRNVTVPRNELAATLYPDLEEPAARNALSVCLHRLRAHLGREDAVVREEEGYRLHRDALVDLWEMERAAEIVRGGDPLHGGQRATLERIVAGLGERRSNRMLRWEWFEPTERRLRELQIDILHRLAGDAFERGDAREALARATEVIAQDACDEPAREVAIRAHLALGDRAAALRQYRQYRYLLQVELQCEPSAALTKLVS